LGTAVGSTVADAKRVVARLRVAGEATGIRGASKS
jgi:hypothetical protein|tara:strand:+ start:503 stop:607 length:105 start_codon:yes stop_codon:yes gene_type:complete